MPIVDEGQACLGLVPHSPQPQDPEQRLSDNKEGGELSKGREGPSTINWLILAQLTSHHHQGVQREEEKPRTPRRLPTLPWLRLESSGLSTDQRGGHTSGSWHWEPAIVPDGRTHICSHNVIFWDGNLGH